MLFASFAMRASVWKRGSPSSVGSKTRKSVIGVASAQKASASEPSSTGGDFAAAADAVVTAMRADGVGRDASLFAVEAVCGDVVCALTGLLHAGICATTTMNPIT